MKADQFEKEFVEASRIGKDRLDHLPKASSARFEPRTKRLVVDLENGSTLIVPTELIQGLAGAGNKALSQLELMSAGSQIHWPDLDVQMHVVSLLDGLFGTRSWMDRLKQHYAEIGSRGGVARTPAKAAASRENGRKGGRPRKSTVVR
jgi:hypothetical protein